FDIQTNQHGAAPLLKIVNTANCHAFAQLQCKYGPYTSDAGSEHKVTVRMEYKESEHLYTFHRVKRSLKWEEDHLQELLNLRLSKPDPLFNNLNIKKHPEHIDGATNTHLLINWINVNHDFLINKGYQIEQKTEN